MADPKFFKRTSSFTLAEIAERSCAQIGEGCDPDFVVEDVAPLGDAVGDQLSFLDNKKYKDQFRETKAGAVIVHSDLADLAPKGVHVLVSAQPYKSYALAAQAFYPDDKPEAAISDRSVIDPLADIGKGAVIEAGVVVKSGAVIGADAWLQAGCVIGENVQLGSDCRIGEGAVVSHAVIGNHVRLYPGAKIGQDGFGFAIDPAGHVKVPQLGRVILEDHVQVGANSCIDRGAGPDTVIGAGTWMDNLVQIGHNVKIGRGCILVAQCGIAGSSELGDFVALGGQSAVSGHLRVGSGVRIGGQSGVMKDIPDGGGEYLGSPAVPLREHMRQFATLKRLIKKGKSA